MTPFKKGRSGIAQYNFEFFSGDFSFICKMLLWWLLFVAFSAWNLYSAILTCHFVNVETIAVPAFWVVRMWRMHMSTEHGHKGQRCHESSKVRSMVFVKGKPSWKFMMANCARSSPAQLVSNFWFCAERGVCSRWVGILYRLLYMRYPMIGVWLL